jgi:hypothetical protein
MRLRQSVMTLHNETHRKGGDSTYSAAHDSRGLKRSNPRASSARLRPTFSGRISQAFDGWITKGEAHSDEWAAVRRRSLCAIGHGSVSGRFIILRCLMQVGGSSGGACKMDGRRLCAGPHHNMQIPLTEGRCNAVGPGAMMCVK